MRILITGGCGFLGSNLAARALDRGDELAILDDLSRDGASGNLAWLRGRGKFRFSRMDVRDARKLAGVVRRFAPQAVFHLAGQVAMTTSLADPRADFTINAGGSFNLLEAVRSGAPDAAVLYSSTNKVYGDLEQFTYRETPTRYECLERPEGLDETTPLDFRTPYGCSKGAADQYMLDYAGMFGLKTVVFRHSSMYGGRQFATYDQGWVGWFAQKAVEAMEGRAGKPFTISGSGKQVRDILHAEDLVDLYFSALENIEAARGQAFNIGGGRGNSLSLLELLSLLEELTGAKLEFTRLPARRSDQRVFIADIAKARARLGWQPRVGTIPGLEKMIDWIRHGMHA
jgi:CDP-paratose 2-epimerase